MVCCGAGGQVRVVVGIALPLCSATIAARTASTGELIRSVCGTAKNRRFVLPSIGEDPSIGAGCGRMSGQIENVYQPSHAVLPSNVPRTGTDCASVAVPPCMRSIASRSWSASLIPPTPAQRIPRVPFVARLSRFWSSSPLGLFAASGGGEDRLLRRKPFTPKV
jgi:hypothetical protein